MTSLGNKSLPESKVKQPDWRYYFPIHPTYTTGDVHSINKPLHLEGNAKMRKFSFVDTMKSYQVHLPLLRKFDVRADVGGHCLTRRSLERVRTASGFPALSSQTCDQQLTRGYTIPTFTRISPLPSSSLQGVPCSRENFGQNTVERNGGHWLPTDELEPLLAPTHTLERSERSCIANNAQIRSRWAEYDQARRPQDDSMQESPAARVFINILKTLLVGGMLLIIVGGIGYGLSLVISRLLHCFHALLKTIK